MPGKGLTSLPRDVLITLPFFLHNIEDFTNLASTCHELRLCLSGASPHLIFRLAVAQTNVFFRPSPCFLIAMTARELGDWARQDVENEATLASTMESGVEALLDLALEHCGLTMERIRHFHQLRFSVFNPVVNIMCECIGWQWPCLHGHGELNADFDNNDGQSTPGTIDAESDETFFRFAIYAELFGPDLSSLLKPQNPTTMRTLSVDTRLHYLKYCIPGWGLTPYVDPLADPRVIIKPTGAFARGPDGQDPYLTIGNANWALLFTLRHPTWRRHWRDFCRAAGCEDAVFDTPRKYSDLSWRQQLWLNIIMCQSGIEGLEMISPAVPIETRVERWGSRIRTWSKLISWLGTAPKHTPVGNLTIPEVPCVIDELWVLDGNRAR